MVAVQITDLQERAGEIVRRLQETGESVQILDEERVVAKLVPATDADEAALLAEDEAVRRWLADLDELSEEIGASVPPGTTVEDVMRDIRRDL